MPSPDSLARSFIGPRFQLATDIEQRYLTAMAALGEPPYPSSEVAARFGARDLAWRLGRTVTRWSTRG